VPTLEALVYLAFLISTAVLFTRFVCLGKLAFSDTFLGFYWKFYLDLSSYLLMIFLKFDVLDLAYGEGFYLKLMCSFDFLNYSTFSLRY
jgi:hypothetical protein